MIDPIIHSLSSGSSEFRVAVDPSHSPSAGLHPPVAAVFGTPAEDCLVRIQSRCVYGEIFGSTDCDCGRQLSTSLQLIRNTGAGVLIYLDQEGRGLGLIPKALGYQISQATGVDSFQAYVNQGLYQDIRSYGAAAKLLIALNLTTVRLLTNNPAKVQNLVSRGIKVTRIPLWVQGSSTSDAYQRSKIKAGHAMADIPFSAPKDAPSIIPTPASWIAAEFHESYERLAPDHGYATREASRVSWDSVPDNNKSLMIATVQDLIDRGVILFSDGKGGND